VKRTEDGLPQTYYLRSSVLGGQVVAKIVWASVSWQWNRGYVYLGSHLLAVQQGGVYWMHEDPVTKSKRVTNGAGTVVSTIELDPWGAEVSNRSSNVAFQPKKFTSYERDGNGSDDAMFRRYNRWQSRFDQPDPYDGAYNAADPQSFNRYAYVQGDPANYVDPTGLLMTGQTCYVMTEGTHWYRGNSYVGTTISSQTIFCTWGSAQKTGGNGGGLGLDKRIEEWWKKWSQIRDELDACYAKVDAEKNKQFEEKIGATAAERLEKVYKGVLPTDLERIGPGLLVVAAKKLAGQAGAGVGFLTGVAAGMVYRTWSNSLPIFKTWARIKLDWYNARGDCLGQSHQKLKDLGPYPRLMDPVRQP
jgi:RHS repeat-associated protein